MSTTRRSWLTAMWVAASGLVVLGTGCKKAEIENADKYGGPSPPKYGGPPQIDGPPEAPRGTWYPVAASAISRSPQELDDVIKRQNALNPDRAAEVVKVLDAMAARPATPDGVEEASKLGHDADLVGGPNGIKGGAPPNVIALHDGGIAVLLGLVAAGCEAAKKSGKAKDGALALVKVIRRMPLPKRYNSAGVTNGELDRRSLLEEARRHFDDEVWVAVLRESNSWPLVPNPP